MDHLPNPQDDLDLDKVLSQLNNEPPKALKAKPNVFSFASEAQAKAIGNLETLYKLRILGAPGAGFRLRTHGLVVGPSGSGKSTTLQLLAQRHGLPLMCLSAGQWSVNNARSGVYTLAEIRDFVRHNRHGLILIDEIDKLTANFAREQAWTSSVLQEIYGLFDGDNRLAAAGFSTDDLARLSRHFLLVGAGAWQDVWTASLGDNSPASDTYVQRILRSSGLPDELLLRFSEPPIAVLPPEPPELVGYLEKIYRELGFAPLTGELLRQEAETAYRAGRGLRHLENVYTALTARRLEDRNLKDVLAIQGAPPNRPRTIPTGESPKDAERRLASELMALAVALEETDRELGLLLPCADQRSLGSLYRALACNTLEHDIEKRLGLTKQELDRLPSGVALDPIDLEVSESMVAELRQAFLIVTRALSVQTAISPSSPNRQWMVAREYGGWVRERLAELLAQRNNGDVGPVLAQVLSRFAHGYTTWMRTYDQLMALLS